MQVTVTKPLNLRLTQPCVNAHKGIPLDIGDVIDFDSIVKGDRLDYNEIWLKKKDGSFVWSGGTNFKLIASPYYKENPRLNNVKEAIALVDNDKWWIKNYGIDTIWTKYNTLGEGVKIAILDTGMALANDFNHDLISGWNYLSQNNLYGDYDGHGTKAAGIIGSFCKAAMGIAPNANLFIAKFSTDVNSIASNLANCLNSLIGTDIDIISISHSFSLFDDDVNKIKEAITLLDDKLIVCSCGNDGSLDAINKTPSSLSKEFFNTISVSACDHDNNILDTSTRSNTISLSAPGQNIVTIDHLCQPSMFSETSAATPFVAGVLALMLSASANRKTKSEIINALLSTCTPKAPHDRFGRGIINPVKAIDSLNLI